MKKARIIDFKIKPRNHQHYLFLKFIEDVVNFLISIITLVSKVFVLASFISMGIFWLVPALLNWRWYVYGSLRAGIRDVFTKGWEV